MNEQKFEKMKVEARKKYGNWSISLLQDRLSKMEVYMSLPTEKNLAEFEAIWELIHEKGGEPIIE